MSDPVSALGGVSFDGYVKVTELPPQGMITLRGDLSDTAIKNAVTGVAGVDLPGQRACAFVENRGAAWMSPDELLILLPHDEADAAVETMTSALSGVHSLAVNVSDARAVFRLEGACVREIVAKLAPVDMRGSKFGPGEIRRTRFAQVPAAFWMRDAETIDIVCFRSVAEYMFGLLKASVGEGGQVGAKLSLH